MKTLRHQFTIMTAGITLALISMTAIAAPLKSPEMVANESVQHSSVQPFQPDRYAKYNMADKVLLSNLNLSTNQKNQISKINAQYPRAVKNTMMYDDKVLQSLRQQRRELIANKNFDEAKARNILKRESEIFIQKQQQRFDSELQKLRRDHAVYQVLTPKQREQLMKQRVEHY